MEQSQSLLQQCSWSLQCDNHYSHVFGHSATPASSADSPPLSHTHLMVEDIAEAVVGRIVVAIIAKFLDIEADCCNKAQDQSRLANVAQVIDLAPLRMPLSWLLSIMISFSFEAAHQSASLA